MMNALVYTHTFSDGSIYFGNASSPNRPFEQGFRGSNYLSHYEIYGEPLVEIVASGLSIEMADALERKLFDAYVENGGLKIQKRPTGKDLAHWYWLGKNSAGRVVTSETRLKQSQIQKGKPKTASHKEAMKGNQNALGNVWSEESKSKMKGNQNAKKANRKVVSFFDGRVTSFAQVSRWNKKNPNYIGTWVEVKESEAANG
jgi:hypothetical protein